MLDHKSSHLKGLAQSGQSPKVARSQEREDSNGLISAKQTSNLKNQSRGGNNRSQADERTRCLPESYGLDNKTILTPGQTVKKHCVHCCGNIASEVPTCDGINCPFHKHRMGIGKPSVKVIRTFCLECMGESPSMVANCQTTDCYCHPYRFGRSLARRKGRTAKEMEEMRAKRTKLFKEKGAGVERSLQG